MCEAKSEGLVRYPTTLAPVSGSVTVTAQCADNAHTTNSTSMSVICSSSGNWSGPTPLCHCNEGYHETTQDKTQICKGQYIRNFILRSIPFSCIRTLPFSWC